MSRKIFLSLLVGIIVWGTIFFPHTAYGLTEDCPVFLNIRADKQEVPNLNTAVNFTAEVTRNYPAGDYCATTDRFEVRFKVLENGPEFGPVSITIEADPIDGGRRQIKSGTYGIQLNGLSINPNVSDIQFGATAKLVRTIGVTTREYTVTAENRVNIRNLKQNPPPQNNNNGINPGPLTNNNGPFSNTNNVGTGVNTNVTVGGTENYDRTIGTFDNLLNIDNIPALIVQIIRILLGAIATLAIIVIIVSGFRMVIASGNEATIKNARSAITWSVLGLVVALLSFSIVAIIQRLIQS